MTTCHMGGRAAVSRFREHGYFACENALLGGLAAVMFAQCLFLLTVSLLRCLLASCTVT